MISLPTLFYLSLYILTFLLLSVTQLGWAVKDSYGNEVNLTVTASKDEVEVGEELTITVKLSLSSPSNPDVIIYENDVELLGEKTLENLGFLITAKSSRKTFLSINNRDNYERVVEYQVIPKRPGRYPLNFFKVRYKVYLANRSVPVTLEFPPDSYTTIEVKPKGLSGLQKQLGKKQGEKEKNPSASPYCPDGISPQLCLILKIALISGGLLLLAMLVWWLWRIASEGDQLKRAEEMTADALRSLETSKSPKTREVAVKYIYQLPKEVSEKLELNLNAIRRSSEHIRRALEGADLFSKLNELERDLEKVDRALKWLIASLAGYSGDPYTLAPRELEGMMSDLKEIPYSLQEDIAKLLNLIEALRYGPEGYKLNRESWKELVELVSKIEASELFNKSKLEEILRKKLYA